MKAEAVRRGHFGGLIRNAGDQFELDNRQQFSSVWMKWIEEPKDNEPDGQAQPIEPPEPGPSSDDLVGQPLAAAEPPKPTDPMAKARAAKAAKAAARKAAEGE